MAVANKLNTRTKKPDLSPLLYGKMPPQASDLEGAVLGAIMLEPQKLAEVLEIIQAEECFYADANQRIYAAIRRLFDKGSRIDFMTVCEDLRKNNELEMVGGSYYVTGLTRDIVSSANIEEHARIVMQKYIMRELIRMSGEVIGVNSQIASESRASAGVGFAVPSNLVKKVATELITNGKVNYSFLGISSGSEMSLTLINALNLPNNLQGVIVNDVNANGPAGQAGLRAPGNERVLNGERVPTSADIITAIDGQSITGMSGLVSYLASNTIPGQTVNLSVWRDGQEIVIPVTLGQRPN